MPLKGWVFMLALAAARGTEAVKYLEPTQYCVAACSEALDYVSFDGQLPASAASDPSVPCTSKHYVQSLFYCSSAYCTPEQAKVGLDYNNETCLSSSGNPLPSYTTFMEQHPSAAAESVTRVSEEDVKKQNFTQPVVPDEDFYQLSYRSTAAMYRAASYNWDFAWALYGYWGLVVLVGMGNRAIQSLRHHRSRPKSSLINENSFGRRSSSPIARTDVWIRRHLLLPLTVGNNRELPFASPTRIEGLLIALYVVMNFVFCFLGYDVFEGNLYTAETRLQLGQYVCNRAGTLALANIPIIWIFATRNDPFLWLIGWSYASFSQFHRWAARTATLLAISHGVGYSILHGWEGRYISGWSYEFFYCGVISVISMSILIGSSLFFVRNRWYDLFIAIHFVFALVLLVCIWFHTKIQISAFHGFIWPAIAIWALDRALRWGRVLYISLIPNCKGAKATATFDEDIDLIRLDVSEFFKQHTPPPGSFYYVYEPGQVRGYESHPFTLCSWNHALPASRTSMSSLESPIGKEPEKGTMGMAIGTDISKDVEMGVESISVQDPISDKEKSSAVHHTFLICPRDGFTNRLRAKTSASSGKTKKSREIRVLLEGPYGCELTLHQYSTVVMVVGGSGITAAVSRIYSLLRHPGAPQLVHLVWATQRRDMVDDICTHELQGVLGSPRLKMDVYLTSAPTNLNRKGEKALPYALHTGRPDIPSILEEERRNCQGSMAVFCCGPSGIERSTRNGVVKLLGEKGPHVAFYQERFGW